ncbi:MFS transporter [Kribbella solani]|uniref:MFS family permease n=1 Tax=Kribbella solani TaxID=236067 RepID=A0A841DZD3_9ACTN|nr:MFS transporter [Kribbella solani]MBB5980578.1 MFS family permease [Kribbella solani]MDX2968877.1 MFS transporter [Kribbella solani]MDX3002666.1 MFS transporter [Kribbella solani]
MTPPTDPDTQRIPVRYWIWLFGAAVSLLGDLTMTFGIGWSASQHGGRVAGLVLLLAAAPRAALLLVGGAVGDRFGAPRVLMASCAAMFAVTAALVPTTLAIGEPVGLLLVLALVVGVIDAFFLPSSRSMPRLLVPPEQVPRALASFQVTGVVFAVSGTAVGGVLVAWSGLAAAAGFDALTFGAMIVVLVLLRKTIAPPGRMPTGMIRSIVAGIQVAFGRPLTRALLITMTVAAGLLMPLDALLFPLLARSHGWSASTAGLLVASRSLGVGVIALRILMRGAFPRPGIFAAVGLLVAAVGLFGLSVFDPLPLTFAAGVLSGIGVGTFTGHVLPLLMNSVEREFQSRLQSIVVLCQSIALVVMNPILGSLSDVGSVGITGVCLAISVASALTGFVVLTRPVLRSATVS